MAEEGTTLVTKEQLVRGLKNLKEAYAIYTRVTNMPYVECDPETFDDQIWLFTKEEDAKAFCESKSDLKIPFNITRMQMAEMKTAEENPQAPKRYINQVSQFIANLPYIGVNAILFKGDIAYEYSEKMEKDGKTRVFQKQFEASITEMTHIDMDDILPQGFAKKVSENLLYNPGLQLTGIYFTQAFRKAKEFVNMEEVKELEEEFSANLSKTTLVIGVVPQEEYKPGEPVNLKTCKLPGIKLKNEDMYLPIFSDIWEFQKYAAGKKELRPIQLPFKQLENLWAEGAKGYCLNPKGFAVNLDQKLIKGLVQRFGLEQAES